MIKLSHLLAEATKQITPEQGKKLYMAMGLDKTKVDLDQFVMGLNVELEHIDVIGNNLKKLALLVLAHLKEVPDYYTKLQAVEKPGTSEVPPASMPGGEPSPQVPPQY